MDLVNLGRPRPDNGHMVGVQSRVDTHGGEQSCLCHTNTFLCIHFSANGCEHAMTRPQVFFVLWGMAVILCNDTFALPSSRYLFSPFKHRLLLLASHCLMSTVFFFLSRLAVHEVCFQLFFVRRLLAYLSCITPSILLLPLLAELFSTRALFLPFSRIV